MTLDELYGHGSASALNTVLTPPAKLGVAMEWFETPNVQPDDAGVRVYTTYKRGESLVGKLKFDCFVGRCHFQYMWLIAEIRAAGILTLLVRRFGSWFGARGIDTCTLTARDDYSAWVFRRTGAEPLGGSLFGYRRMTNPPNRLTEYTSYKLDGGPEPAWHLLLGPERPSAADPSVDEDL